MGSWELAKSKEGALKILKVDSLNYQEDFSILTYKYQTAKSADHRLLDAYNEYLNAEKKSAEGKYSKMLYLAALFLVTDERNNKCSV